MTTANDEEHMMEPQLTTEVVGLREDDAWCAIALEMSLRGYGDTFEEALEDLCKAIAAQLTFAVQHGTIDEIFIPAEKRYFKLYKQSKREMLRCKLEERKPSFDDCMARDIPFPEPKGAFAHAHS